MRDCVHGELTSGAELRWEGDSMLIKSACTPKAYALASAVQETSRRGVIKIGAGFQIFWRG